jgi:hypothetical protein
MRVKSSFRSSRRSCKVVVSDVILTTYFFDSASETHIRRPFGLGQARIWVYNLVDLRIGDGICGGRFFCVAHDGQIFEQKKHRKPPPKKKREKKKIYKRQTTAAATSHRLKRKGEELKGGVVALKEGKH